MARWSVYDKFKSGSAIPEYVYDRKTDRYLSRADRKKLASQPVNERPYSVNHITRADGQEVRLGDQPLLSHGSRKDGPYEVTKLTAYPDKGGENGRVIAQIVFRGEDPRWGQDLTVNVDINRLSYPAVGRYR